MRRTYRQNETDRTRVRCFAAVASLAIATTGAVVSLAVILHFHSPLARAMPPALFGAAEVGALK